MLIKLETLFKISILNIIIIWYNSGSTNGLMIYTLVLKNISHILYSWIDVLLLLELKASLRKWNQLIVDIWLDNLKLKFAIWGPKSEGTTYLLETMLENGIILLPVKWGL